MKNRYKVPNLLQAFIPIVFLIGLIGINVYYVDDTLAGANQIALLLAAAVASVIAIRLGHSWSDIRARIVSTIGSAMPSMLILLLIGSLAGTWLISGVVPALIYYGLGILHPKIFLFAAVIITSTISLATGSSWSTVATIGVALLGIGLALGFNAGIVAGAIISGSYFGDKMSPLSDTTNLAPAMAGTDLFTHVRYMIYTTGPTLAITLIIFLILGFTIEPSSNSADIQGTVDIIQGTFNITPMLFIVPIALIVIIMLKTPPLPSLLAGTLLGGVFAVIFQPQIVEQVAGLEGNYVIQSYLAVLKSMFGDVQIATANEAVSELFHTRGMAGMLNTIWLILSAMVFGGAMEASGLLARISQSIISLARSTTSLVAATVGSCVFLNITASDQYIAIVVPGRMFAKAYRDKGLKPELLSRTLEDAGTVTSVLVPWNTCGATQAAVLGVPTLTYMPFAFFNILSPFMSIIMAMFNIKIRRFTPEELAELDGEAEKV